MLLNSNNNEEDFKDTTQRCIELSVLEHSDLTVNAHD